MIAKFHSIYNIFEEDIEIEHIKYPMEISDEELNDELEFLESENLPIDCQGIDTSFIEMEETILDSLIEQEPLNF